MNYAYIRASFSILLKSSVIFGYRHSSLVDLCCSSMEKEKEREKANPSSPDTILEDFLRSAESQTDSSKASTSESLVEIDPKPASRLALFFKLLRFKSKRQLATLQPLTALKLSKRFSSFREQVSSAPNALLDPNMNYFKPQWKNFSLLELQTATSNFCQG